MPIIKVFDIPKSLPKCVLPKHILSHCYLYKEAKSRKASLFAWICLSKYIDLKKVRFAESGRPYSIESGKYFSLSHSNDKVAIAIYNKPIGVDIELVKPNKLLAKRLLTKQEYQQYLTTDNPDLWFAKYWTKYEAQIKLGVSSTTNEHIKTSKITHSNHIYIVTTIYY